MMKTDSSSGLLKQLIAIPSVFPNEQEVSKFISNYLADIGFSVQHVATQANRNNIVASFGKAQRYLGFYGHMDTVPPASDYTRDPFVMVEEGNIGKGLGVADMKGGITCMLLAARWAAQNNYPLKVVCGVDEENISEGAHNLVDSKLLNDIEFLVVAESGQVKDINQPFSSCIGRKGRIVFEIVVHGKAAHAAVSHEGVNAVSHAAKLISLLEKEVFPTHPNLGVTNLVVQSVSGSSSSFSVPDRCIISLSLLTTPLVKSSDLVSRVKRIASENGIKLDISTAKRATPYGESYEMPKENLIYQRIYSEILKPVKVEPIYTASVADENVFANRLNIPVLTLGPIGEGDHTKDEWVKLDSLDSTITAYTKIITLYSK